MKILAWLLVLLDVFVIAFGIMGIIGGTDVALCVIGLCLSVIGMLACLIYIFHRQ